MATVVLVHGAFVGGWAWQDVARRLRSKGHVVYAPTLTGLGERVHLARPETDLETHIRDITQVLFYEDLRDVVLVGWSSGGMSVTVVADRVPERIQHLIHIDGDVPEDGESEFDLDPSMRVTYEERARTMGDGWRVPIAADLSAFAERLRAFVPEDTRRTWMVERVTPQPIRTFSQSIRLRYRSPPGVRQTYLRCAEDTAFADHYARIVARLQASPAWEVQNVPVNHFGPYAEPDLIATALDEIVS